MYHMNQYSSAERRVRTRKCCKDVDVACEAPVQWQLSSKDVLRVCEAEQDAARPAYKGKAPL